MVPLTALVLLPLIRPHSLHWSNLAGFHLRRVRTARSLLHGLDLRDDLVGTGHGGGRLLYRRVREPAPGREDRMTVGGRLRPVHLRHGAVMLVAVLGSTSSIDPLIAFRPSRRRCSVRRAWVHWMVGVPLVIGSFVVGGSTHHGGRAVALPDLPGRLLPRWFGKANSTAAGHAMCSTWSARCWCCVRSPVRIYIFSNLGYLLALLLAWSGTSSKRSSARSCPPGQDAGALRWWPWPSACSGCSPGPTGGWNSPELVVGEKSHVLFLIGLAVVAAYLPLYGWRRLTDRWRSPAATVIAPLEPAAASASPGSRPTRWRREAMTTVEFPTAAAAPAGAPRTRDELAEAIARDGIEFLFAMFVDLHGKPCAKLIPVSALDSFLAEGAGFAGYAAGPMGQSPADPDLAAMPDLSSTLRCRGSRASPCCSAIPTSTGPPGRYAPRVILRRALDRLAADGMVFNVGAGARSTSWSAGGRTAHRVADPLDNGELPCYDAKG